MDLRSGHSYWLLKNGILASYPPLRENTTCEVAVIGAGITGALTAFHLVQEGIDVVVLDRRAAGTGSTAASTALLQHAADTELADLIAMVGAQAAIRSYRLGLEAVDKLERLIADLNGGCGFARRQSLYLASAKSHVAKLQTEFDIRRRHGFAVEFLSERDIEDRFPFTAPAAILADGDAEVDAFRLTHLLLKKAVEKGVGVFDRTEVTRIVARRRGFSLSTQDGGRITAQRVVFATGYESQKYLKQRVGTLHSTFALATEPIQDFPAWPGRCLIWETARPYCYLRATDDNRIIVGGKDTPFATAHRQDSLVKRKCKQLIRRLGHLFPKTELDVAFTWAGTFGTTKDGLAYIGVSPEWPNAYFALGYGGNGITMSLTAAELIRDHYLGRANPDAHIFAFAR